MTPGVLTSVIRLVEDGATVVGYPPSASPSLMDFPACDAEVKLLAQSLWGQPPYATKMKSRPRPGAARFRSRGVHRQPSDAQPQEGGDCIYPDYAVTADMLEKSASPRISNPTDHSDSSTGARPPPTSTSSPIHRPRGGHQRHLPGQRRHTAAMGSRDRRNPQPAAIRAAKRRHPRATRPRALSGILHRLHPRCKPAPAVNPTQVNFPEAKPLLTLDGPWQLAFAPQRAARRNTLPRQRVDNHETRHQVLRISTYRKSFTHQASKNGQPARFFLDLGKVHDIARVRLNGRDLGVVWCAPWQVEVTGTIRDGDNHLEIDVANRWSNRQLGDTQPPRTRARSSGTMACLAAWNSKRDVTHFRPVPPSVSCCPPA